MLLAPHLPCLFEIYHVTMLTEPRVFDGRWSDVDHLGPSDERSLSQPVLKVRKMLILFGP